ncbi:MAG TPA: CoA pyrophosphatase [Bacteroidales bacterium]|nr:CoA pyrophosphatase [Bacteroidales bacterium]HPT02257.1 CoA pyrophosphatase [Bacteroidales bacterium]
MYFYGYNNYTNNFGRMVEKISYRELFSDWPLFKYKLSTRLSEPLPGKEAQYKLAPVHRQFEKESGLTPDHAVESSVLLTLFPENNSVKSVVILRNEYDGVHSGQVSLPGGRKESSDKSNYHTALRETKEEIGIQPDMLIYCGTLTSLYISRSNFNVFPFVATIEFPPSFVIDNREVKELIVFDLLDITPPGARMEKKFRLRDNFTFNAPGFLVGGHFMWGATAMIFSEFLQVIEDLRAPPLS